MTPDKRLKLEERRRALQQQIELDERRSLVDFQMRELDRCGVTCEVDFDTDPLVDWAFGQFPVDRRGIAWNEVGNHRCEPGDDGILLLSRLILEEGMTEADDEVEVLFSNGRSPALRIRFADVLAHGTVLASDFEVWLLCRRRGWIMEYISTRGWCWGKVD
jgi:hypothetical protein